MKVLQKIDQFLEEFCKIGLVISLSGILFFCVLNIILRWFDSTLLWVDPLVRHLVFLCAFLGGALATGRGQHIGIDIISKLLEQGDNKSMIQKLRGFISFISMVTLIWLTKAGFSMTLVEWEYGKESFLGIHSSVLMGIIPLGFIIIAYRFFYLVISGLTTKAEA